MTTYIISLLLSFFFGDIYFSYFLPLATDQTIRIWNYETGNIELVRKFQVDVHVVELHNSGLLAAIGFADQLRVTQIFMDELNVCKSVVS